MRLRTRNRAYLVAVAVALPLLAAAPAGANRLCVVNTDPDHAHRFFWIHANYDYAIHEEAIPAGGSACLDSEFLLGPGWRVKGLVQLYDDHSKTAGDEVYSRPIDMERDDASRRVDLCFEFDRAAVSYTFRSQDCP